MVFFSAEAWEVEWGGTWRALTAYWLVTCHLCKSGGTEPSPGRLGREVLMHTAETSKAWDSLLPEAQGKLLRENESHLARLLSQSSRGIQKP